jgi:hypothetical protein
MFERKEIRSASVSWSPLAVRHARVRVLAEGTSFLMTPRGVMCPSLAALQLFAGYDMLRLRTYQEGESLGERIRMRSIGTAHALRFDEVGYFNRVYAPDETVSEQIPEVEKFYRGCTFGCELIGPKIGSADRIDEVCRTRGWIAGGRYAWLYSRMRDLPVPRVCDDFQIRPLHEREHTLFLTCYLRGFEAEPDRFPAALRNMRHLFGQPGLQFVMAWKGGVPAGVAMLCRSGNAAVLCAGATLPEYRFQGCHAALLAERIRLATQQDCESIFSWALAGSRSERNMVRAGLQVAGVTSAWRLRAG